MSETVKASADAPARLSGTLGEVDGGFQADVKLDATELDVAEVLQLWPEKIAAGARACDPPGAAGTRVRSGESGSARKRYWRSFMSVPPASGISPVR